MVAVTKTFSEEHYGQRQGSNKGTRNAAKKNRLVGIRRRAAKAALATAKTASSRITPPKGIWRLDHRNHKALRGEIEHLYAVEAAQARLAGVGGDIPQAAFHDGRSSAFLWMLAALDALEALTLRSRCEK